MTLIAESAPLTVDEVLAMPDCENYELLDGELNERDMSTESIWVGTEISTELSLYARKHGGWTFAGGPALTLWPDRPRHFVRPDVAYFAPRQLQPDDIGPGDKLSIAPVLVVEAVSTWDNAQEVMNKVVDYLDAGVRMVWAVYPPTRQVHVYRPALATEIVQFGETLTGYNVLPEFACDTAPLFPPRLATVASTQVEPE